MPDRDRPATTGGRAVWGGQRVLVTGASGFIGRWVARRLSSAGAEVLAVVRDPDAWPEIAERWEVRAGVLVGDLAEPNAVARLLGETEPAVVFNLAGYGVDRAERDACLQQRINVDLVVQLATILARSPSRPSWQGRRLVHVGSALEYGLATGILSEATEPRPHTAYGRSKLAATRELAAIAVETGLSSVTARLFTVFGPGEHDGRLLPTLRRAARDSRLARLSAGTQARDFSYVEDVADALIALGETRGTDGGTVNVASGRLTTVRRFAEQAASVLGLAPSQLLFGDAAVRDDEMGISGVAVDRLRSLVGWVPDDDITAGVSRSEEFERDHPGPAA